jgi:class 3 adenylate cyclase
MSTSILPKLAAQYQIIHDQLAGLPDLNSQEEVEAVLTRTIRALPDIAAPDGPDFYSALNHQLYRNILKSYKHQESKVCIWRFIKNLSTDQLNYEPETDPALDMLDALLRVYFYSGPLNDLTCVFIPINDGTLIKKYLGWIKNYFYNVNYPTSLLWLYALDSSLGSLFPDEIIYMGRHLPVTGDGLLLPDFSAAGGVLFKRFSSAPQHFIQLEGTNANDAFRHIFAFLRREYQDRCLSQSIRKNQTDAEAEAETGEARLSGWEKYEDVLRFGVSDKNESGCVSFADMRSSTEFLNSVGKTTYLNKVQQPFFEQTQIISRHFKGRIDKFMGDNVMSVFLDNNMSAAAEDERAIESVLNSFLAYFALCKMFYAILVKNGFDNAKLGLRCGTAYGDQILRSNLGNEFVRDFTVTGEKVNLASRLESISISELIIHNQLYFAEAIERFPKINQIIEINQLYINAGKPGHEADRAHPAHPAHNLNLQADINDTNMLEVVTEANRDINPETMALVRDYTYYQNILTNLESLNKVKFDLRMNDEFYHRFCQHLMGKGYKWLNPETSVSHGYDAFKIGERELRFYMSYYNPKGFLGYQIIWILPLDSMLLADFDIEQIR